MDERALLNKLERIQRLVDGATTPGEQDAARRARGRIRARLERLRATGAGAHSSRPSPRARRSRGPNGIRSKDPPEDPPEDPALDPRHCPLPEVAEFEQRLDAWSEGRSSGRTVAAWAAGIVDAGVLPSFPAADPRSARVELLMQLSCWRYQPLWRPDIPHALAFLRAGDGEMQNAWRAWFAHLEKVQWPSRRGARNKRAG